MSEGTTTEHKFVPQLNRVECLRKSSLKEIQSEMSARILLTAQKTFSTDVFSLQ